jgi:hypothetical protein
VNLYGRGFFAGVDGDGHGFMAVNSLQAKRSRGETGRASGGGSVSDYRVY